MDERITITLCGDGGCGKSSITLRIVRSQWTHEYDPTIEDSYSVTRTIDGTTFSLAITDTAGQEEYRGMWSASNLSSDAFLLVYDITSPGSIQALDFFTQMIEVEREARQERGECWPAVMVAANKCDLQAQRQVGAREGLEWAKMRGCGFMETSAREMVNVEETFAALVRRVVEARRLHASGIRPKFPSLTEPTADYLKLNSPTSKYPPQAAAPPPAAAGYAEKALPQQPVSGFLPDFPPENKGKSFFGRLKCW